MFRFPVFVNSSLTLNISGDESKARLLCNALREKSNNHVLCSLKACFVYVHKALLSSVICELKDLVIGHKNTKKQEEMFAHKNEFQNVTMKQVVCTRLM